MTPEEQIAALQFDIEVLRALLGHAHLAMREAKDASTELNVQSRLNDGLSLAPDDVKADVQAKLDFRAAAALAQNATPNPTQ